MRKPEYSVHGTGIYYGSWKTNDSQYSRSRLGFSHTVTSRQGPEIAGEGRIVFDKLCHKVDLRNWKRGGKKGGREESGKDVWLLEFNAIVGL